MLLTAVNLTAATYTNNGTGLFSAGTTWVGGVAPSLSGDQFVITNGTVIYDLTNKTVAWGGGQIQKGGILQGTNSPLGTVYFLNNGNITISGNGQFNAGQSNAPISYFSQELQGFVYQPTNTAQIILTGQTNSLNWFGQTNRQQAAFLTANGLSGTNCVTVSQLPVSVQSNDVVILANNNVQGQNSYYYVIAAITNNMVYFKQPAQLGAETNYYPRATFSATLPALFPTNSPCVFVSCPIAIFEPSYLNQSVSAGGGNLNTLTGAQISVQYGIFQQSQNQIMNNCTLEGNNAGGACYNSCSATTLNNCTLAGNSGGGACYNSCSATTLNNCTLAGNSGGGACNNSCSATTLNNCTLAGNNAGGACYSFCSATTLNNCTLAGNTYGGACNNSCSATTLNNCTNDSNALFYQCFQAFIFGTKSSGDTFPALAGWPFAPFQYDNYLYLFNTGSCGLTNGIYYYSITSTTNPIYLTIGCSLKNNSSRTVKVGVLLTNNIQYAVTYGANSIAFGPATLNNWTNVVLTALNTNSYPIMVYATISAIATNGAGLGQSTITFGKESTVTKF